MKETNTHNDNLTFETMKKSDTLKFKTFDFAGSLQRSLGEYLEAAITWHYDDFTSNGGDVNDLSDEEIQTDVMNITDNAFGTEFDEVELPDGSVYSREEMEESVEEKITEIYK